MKRAVVTVLLNEDDQILLLKRTEHHGRYPNQWCFPGGKVDPGEEPDMAAFRETEEETGYRMRVFEQMPYRVGGVTHITSVFHNIGTVPSDIVTREFPNREHSEYGWFHPNNLPEDADELVQSYCRLAN